MDNWVILSGLGAAAIFAIAAFRHYAITNAALSALGMGLFFAVLLWPPASDRVRDVQLTVAALAGGLAVMGYERERRHRLPSEGSQVRPE